jgi:hypothetical protein
MGSLRKCDSLGIPVFDLPTCTCLWKTSFCKKFCYNNKLRKVHKNGKAPDGINWTVDNQRLKIWRTKSAYEIVSDWKNSRSLKNTKRMRMCSRGEPFDSIDDVLKMQDIAFALPFVKFWVPTRAWRNPLLRIDIESMLLDLPNVFVQASIDPTTTIGEAKSLTSSGWGTMYFGNDETPLIPAKKCPKTWRKLHGNCATCRLCFTKGTNVWLKKH